MSWNPSDDGAAASSGGAWQELKAGWRPLLACAFGVGLGLSPIPPFTSGLFASELTREFGWPRGQILAAIMLVTVSVVLLGPLLGRMVDRIGARPVAIGSTLGLGLSLASLSLVTSNIWTFYACWAAMAVTAVGSLPITYARVITGSFRKARGLALGIMLGATGVTGAIVPFLLQWVIRNHGWRTAYLALAALPLLIALPMILVFLRETAPPATPGAAPLVEDGHSVGEALRQYRFWALCIAAFALSAGTAGLIPNMLPMLTEGGLTVPVATAALSLIALTVIIGRVATGFLLDRFWGPLVGVLILLPAMLAMWMLAQHDQTRASAFFAVAAVGLIAGAEFDLVAYLTGRYFGRRHFSEIYAIQYAVFGIGAGTAPAAFGAMRDAFGGYRPGLAASGLLFAASAIALLSLGRYPASTAPPAPPAPAPASN